jgi:hypothetical protein
MDTLGFLTEDHMDFWEVRSVLCKHFPGDDEAALIERAKALLEDMLAEGTVVVLAPDGGEAGDPLAAVRDTGNWLFDTGDTAEKPKLYASRKGHDLYFERHRNMRSGRRRNVKEPSSVL